MKNVLYLLKAWFTNPSLVGSLLAGILIGLFTSGTALIAAIALLVLAPIVTAVVIHLTTEDPPEGYEAMDTYEFIPVVWALVLAGTCLAAIGIVKLIAFFL